MFPLNPRQHLLIAALLVATVTGLAVKRWRDARREGLAPVAARVRTASPTGTR